MTKLANDIARAYRAVGGRALLVGGTVRDQILKLPVKDLDWEVFGLGADQILSVAQKFSPVKEVGRSFGILKMRVGSHEIDIGAPRREIKTGPGHRGFAVTIDPTLSPAAAARRRDFTINAIYLDPLTEEVIDPFHGRNDLHGRILRVVDANTFIEDPLRVLRAFQFAARFELSAEQNSRALIARMVSSVRELPADRRREEWYKLFLKSARPSWGLALAMDVSYFSSYPEFSALPHTEQGAEVHPEGDVWKHTLMTVDQTQLIAQRDKLPDRDRLISLLGGLCHDVGKSITTEKTAGKLTTHRHAQAGLTPSRKFLTAEGFPAEIIAPALVLVREHMQLLELFESDRRAPITDGAVRRFLNRLPPATLGQLLALGEGDFRGRGPFIQPDGRPVWPQRWARRYWFLERMKRARLTPRPEPVIRGRDLMELGWSPGPEFGAVITAAERYAEATSADREKILGIISQASSPDEALQKLRPAAT